MAIGPHLLDRIPSPPDTRDYKLENFLPEEEPVGFSLLRASTIDPVAEITAGITELGLTTISFPKWAATKYPDVTKTHWWKALDHFNKAKEALNPTPPPPGATKVQWPNTNPVLDQLNTGHCVGFGSAQWGNTAPVDDHFKNADAHAIYYECKVIDGDPGAENGSYVRSGAEALLARNRLSVYAFSDKLDDVKTWVRTKGPVIVGTDWYDDMFDPDAQGFVKPTGGIAGGHCYLLCGDDPLTSSFIFQNSWGAGWGLNGFFKIKYVDFASLMAAYGEVCVAVELPI